MPLPDEKFQRVARSTSVGLEAGKVKTWEGSKSPRSYIPIVESAGKACASMMPPSVTTTESLRTLATVFAICELAETDRSQAAEDRTATPLGGTL